jgi:putative ABC transport system permease protein
MTGFGSSIRYAARTLARTPGFTVPVVLTLMLGIGAATLMFSVINSVLLRPLPYPEQERLIEIVHAAPAFGIDTLFASPAIYFGYRDRNESFESIGLWDWDNSPATVIGSGTPESVRSLEMTHEVLGILGAEPVLGRALTEADDTPGNTPTVVLSYGFWQRQFAGASPLGQTLQVDGVVREVIGVLPESFEFFDYPAEIFYPLQPRRATAFFPSFDGRAIALLRDGVTVADANADVGRMIPFLSAEFPAPPGFGGEASELLVPNLRPLKQSVVGDLSGTLWMLMGTVAALLLVACANVANLILVRMEARQRDFAIRTALGASRGRVARVVLSEAVFLTLVATASGVLVAQAALPILLNTGVVELPELIRIRIDSASWLFAGFVALFAVALLTLIPIIRVWYSKWSSSTHLTRRSVGIGHRSARTRHSLLVVQVAMAVLLLVGSGLMVRSFVALRSVEPGFSDPNGIQTFQISIPDNESIEQAVRTHQAIVDRVSELPGVERAAFAAFTDGLPMDGDGRLMPVSAEGQSPDDVVAGREVSFVSPDYFEVLSTPLLAGRTFEWTDIYDQRSVALVSENFARSEWGSPAAALGRRIAFRSSGPWIEVIGVLKDIRYDGLTQPAPQSVSLPIGIGDDFGSRMATFVVRGARSGATVSLNEIQQAVWSVNSNLSPANFETLGQLYEQSMARTTLALLVLALTGTAALLLGVVGIYGVYSYAASLRRHEIAIRMALGAREGQLRRMFLGHAVILTGIGAAIGLVAATALTRIISSQLFGVSALDPLTYIASSVLLVVAGVIASYIPARRASRADPQAVLAAE